MELETIEVTLEDGQKMRVVKAEAVEEQLKQKDAELQKEREKEKNFKALRAKKVSELAEEERKALTDKEMLIMERQEALEAKQQEMETNAKKTWKEAALSNLGLADSADSAEDRKKVLAAYDRLARDPEDNADAIAQRMNVAFSIAFQRPANVGMRSIDQATHFGMGGAARAPKKTDFSETPEGLALAKRFGMKFATQEKK